MVSVPSAMTLFDALSKVVIFPYYSNYLVTLLKRRYSNTFLTKEQVEVLSMRASGMTLDAIASRLGVSRTTIHAALKGALRAVEKAKNTLRLYAELMGGITVEGSPRTPVIDLINEIFRKADEHGIKINSRSVEILMQIMRDAPRCIDLEERVLKCRLKILIFSNGKVSIRPTS